MEYKVKQRQIKKIFEVDKLFVENASDMKKSIEMMRRMTPEQRAYKYLTGYLHSLSDALEHRADVVELDLTYGTVENIFTGIASLFMMQKHYNYELNRNIESLEKTVATYFILLAINEHNATLNITPNSNPYGWVGCDILLKNRGTSVDFLKDITGKITFTDNKLTIYIKGLMESYKSLTGKDLEDYDLDDIEISLN